MIWTEMSYNVEKSERHYVDECNVNVIYFEDGVCSFGLLEDLTYKNCMGVEEVMEMIWSE